MGAGNDTITIEDPKTGKIIERVFEGKMDLNEIKSILFIDTWTFNAKDFTFDKEVVSYSPIRKFYKEDDVDEEDAKFVKVFVLNFENFSTKEIKKSNKRLVHYATVKYEQLVDNFDEYSSKELDNIKLSYAPLENIDAPFLNSYNKEILASTILNKVINGEIKSYDFGTKKEYTPLEATGRLGAGNDTITIQDSETGMIIEKVFSNTPKPSEIRSYIFTEDWYLDPITLRIVKKVRAIAPVRYFYVKTRDKEMKLRKKIVFEVKLNE